jgi:hypothetical protein
MAAPKLIKDTLDLAVSVAKESPELGQRLFSTLQNPFAGYVNDAHRWNPCVECLSRVTRSDQARNA